MNKTMIFFISIFFLLISCDQSVNMFLGVGQALDSESPKISITPPENGIYINKSNITIEGQCSDNVGVTRITAEASIADVTAKVTEELFFKKALTGGNWSITFDADKLDRELKLWQSGKEVTFTLTCYDAAGNNMVQHLFLYIDMDMPEVTINVPEKRFKNSEKEEYEKDPVKFSLDYNINEYEQVNSFVNKVFTIKGYIDDNYSVKSTYINIYDSTKEKLVAVTPVIYKDGTSEEIHEGTIGEVKGNSRSWEFTLDSEEFCKDKGWFAIQVVTEDEAGNGKEQKQFVEKSWIYVNQAADVPKNNFTSFSPGLKLNAGNLVGGSCFDDDGMREIWIKIVPEAEANPDEPYTQWTDRDDSSHIIKKYADFTDGGQLKNWNLKCPTKAGVYKIYVVPVDVNDVSPEVPYEGIYVSYFSVASEEDPVVVVDAEFRGSTIVEKKEITGYFYDNEEVSKIEVSMVFDKNEDGKVTLELYDFSKSKDENAIKIDRQDNTFQLTTGQTVVKNFFKWEFDVSKYPAYKELQMTFKTKDEDGNYGEDAIMIYGDSERPSFVGAVTPANNSNIQESNIFKGTVSDNVDVVSVTIKTDGGSAWKNDVICTLGKPERVNGKTVRTFESGEILPIDFGGWADREFTITATDAAGNAVSQIITLKGDKTKPTVIFVDESGEEEKPGNYVTADKVLNVRIKPASFKDGTFREIKKATYSIGTQEKPIDLNISKVADYYSAQIKVADLGKKSGDVTLQVTAVDEEGNDNQGTIYFIVDNEAPNELAITSPLLKNKEEVEKLADDVADINENEISYYQNGEILLKGTVSDNYKIDKTCLSLCKLPDLQEVLSAELTVAKETGKLAVSVDGEKKGAIVNHSGIPSNFTLKLNTVELDNGDYILKTTAYDAAGNSKSWGDDGAGEYYFKVLQEADIPRITFNIEDNATVFPGTVLKGAVIDDDSVKAGGVRFICGTTKYTDDAALAELKKANSAVAKTLDGINQFTRNDWQLEAFQALGEHYLYMIAEDINGKQCSLYKLTINVTSTDSPFIKAINSSAGTGGKMENGYCSGNVKIIVSATGGQADLKYMYYRLTLSSNTGSVSDDIIPVSGTSDSFTFPADGALGKWYKFEFSSSKLDNDNIVLQVDSNKIASGKTDTINIEVMCENSIDTKSVAVKDKIAIDNENPTLKIVTPTGNASVNKEIDISGSCNDRGAGVKGIYVSYQTTPTVPTKLTDITNNLANVPTFGKWCELTLNGVSWEGKFDTEILYKDASEHSYNFTVATVDMLGNITFTQQPITIDQDGDRPIVRFQNLSVPTDGNAIWCNSSSIYGMITDDDGENNIQVYVSEKGGTDWTEMTEDDNCYTGGAWRYDFEGDGEKTLAFKVKDSTGVTFESKDVIDLTTVKLNDSSKDGITKFKVKVDTEDPQIDNYYYCVQKLSDEQEPNGINGKNVDSGVWSNSFSGKVFGGTEDIVWLLFGGEDANGIASGELTCTTENSEVSIDNPIPVTLSDSSKVFYKFKVNISKVNLTLLTFKFELKDNAGRTQTNNFTIDVDNTAPTVNINSHSDGSNVYGTDANTIRGTSADSNNVEKIEYTLTKDNTDPESGYIEISNPLNWEIKFEDNNKLNNKIATLYSVKNEAFSEAPYDVYLWLKATDIYGNVSEPKALHLRVLAMGDKPKVNIDYPLADSVLGGKITVSGTTDISTSSVKEVYIQIDTNYDGSDFDSNWESKLKTNAKDEVFTVETDSKATAVRGIKVTSSSKTNWRLNINENKTMKDKMAVKAIAVSETGKYTESEIVAFTIDEDVPQFTDTNLVQYQNDSVIKKLKYTDEMWVSGEGWCLETLFEDANGINESSINISGINISDEDEYQIEKKAISNGKGGNRGYEIKVPLNTKKFGIIKFTLTGKDLSEKEHEGVKEFIINYDNKVPDFSVEKLSDTSNDRTKIENYSSGVYTIEGTFNEDSADGHNQSGFERIAMYFTRTVGGTTYVIDPMLQKGDDGDDNRDEASSFSKVDGMYWKEVKVLSVNDTEVTVEEVPNNVHNGGLCKIGGAIYRIEDVDEKNIIVEGVVPSTNDTVIYFAVAQVIDNTIIETGTTTFYSDNNSITYDDGDKMVEGVTRVGTTYNWTASINSENIFDGDVDVHFVAFDKAGNSTEEIVYGKVTNNTPRIAGVAFGTDKNSNKAIDDKELIKSYYNLYDTSAKVEDGRLEGIGGVNGMAGTVKVTNLKIPLDDVVVSQMVIKDSVGINAKVVGGNTNLQWQWKIGDSDWSGLKKFKDEGVGSSYGDVIRIDLPMMMITMADFLNAGVDNTTDTTLSIRIWDETEGTTVGEDSQCAEINVVVDTILKDEQAPTVTITPFYWNSESNNSLYQNSRANGHIELPKDLTKAITDELGDDPKVSGKITIEGTATDNVQLKELLATIPGFKDEFTMATYADGIWTSAGNMDTNGWACEVETDEKEENDHKVNWKLHLDTEKIATVTAKDVTVAVKAKDRGKARVNGNDVVYDGTPNTSKEVSCQMDVVPYITDVKTMLWGKKKQNQSVYSRTAKGHYPVASDEKIVLVGFNLGGKTNVDVKGLSSGLYEVEVNGIKTLNNINNNDAHGSNNNPSLADKYNMQPNGETNNTLTDDVYFDVWEINTQAAKAYSGKIVEPVMRINPTNDMIGFAFANGPAHFSMPNSSDNSYTVWQKNYANYNGINFVYSANGYAHSLSTGLDTEPNDGLGGRLQYINSDWGGNGANNMYNWNTNVTVALDSIGVLENTYLNGKQETSKLIDTERFSSPSIAVAGNDRVYIAYFDKFNEQIRFVYGTSSTTTNNRGQKTKTTTGQLSNRVAEKGSIDNDEGGSTYRLHKGFESSNASYSVVAGVEYPDNGTTPTDTKNIAGEHLSLAVIPGTNQTGDVVVFVWYDGTNLNYTYRYGTKDDTDAKSTGVTNKWSATKQIFTDEIGEHCAVTVDKNGGIHIAAYNRSGADLYYAYISDKDATPKTCLVDSYSQVGKYISIDVALNSAGNAVPYISYLGDGFGGLPKVAYLPTGINDSTELKDGADNNTDMFTGVWEVSLIPTSSYVCEDNMNVAVWKNNGVITNSATGDSSSGSSNGTCYGNGKSQFVLGYATEVGVNGFIETAQMK